jgi:hypothetical protein
VLGVLAGGWHVGRAGRACWRANRGRAGRAGRANRGVLGRAGGGWPGVLGVLGVLESPLRDFMKILPLAPSKTDQVFWRREFNGETP